MRVLFWGVGAIGGTVAAHAIRAGHDVTLVDANVAHVEAIRRDGLHIEGPFENFTVPATAIKPEEVEGEWQAILLSVKAQHTLAAVSQLEDHLAADGYVASLQNGLNEHVIAERVGSQRTVGAFVNFSADVLEPGTVHFGGRGAFVLGELDGEKTTRLEALRGLIAVFDPDAYITSDIWAYLWGKMGYGIMLFASALTNASIVDALEAPEAQPLHTALASEVLAVAGAEGVTPKGFNGFDPDAFGAGGSAAARAASFAAMADFNRRSAKTHSGVWRDLAVHKRRTEVDAQYGPILKIAERHNLAMPLTRRLTELVHDIEDDVRSQDWDNLEELRAAAAAAAPDGSRVAPTAHQ